MRPRALARTAGQALGNPLSVAYLLLAALLIAAAASGGDRGGPAGLLALALSLPTGAALLAVADPLGPWVRTGAAPYVLLAVSYLVQALLLGLLMRGLVRLLRGSGETVAPRA
ncbi:hypothetical protein [Streptomyces sp. NPDC097619]|uniref:SCO4225 family membrane protein n=1 Tax=Streptomyces sp. NPDC097619 TaxID=3157228 RepID=UPI003332723F